MPTDLEIAQLTAALEQATTKNWSSFDHVEPPQQDGGVCWGIKAFDDATVVVMRGSITKQDWFRDFLAMPAHEVSPYEKLGPVHLGFSIGLLAAWKIIKPGVTVRQKPLIIAGHSLDAARAWILAGMAIVDGIRSARVVVFGSPRPGFAQLASVVAEVPQKSYRNRYDPVCEVPFTIPPEFPYVEPAPFTMLDVEPAAEASLTITFNCTSRASAPAKERNDYERRPNRGMWRNVVNSALLHCMVETDRERHRM